MHEKIHKRLILFFIPFVLYVGLLPFMPLMEPDEGRYSSIPSAMNASEDYITPRLKAAVYFEKPPLAYWATAAAFQLFGENEFSSRLFAALCAWGCILLAYRMGTFFHDTRSGLYAAAVLTTFLFHVGIGRINILDMPLAFFVCLAIWSGFRHLEPAEKHKYRLYLLYVYSALAFLTKGLIGIVFPFGVLVIWLIISRRWRNIFTLFSPIGILLFAVITVPWLLLVQHAHPDFFRFFFIQEHLLRFATRMHDRYQPLYFYIPIVLAGTFPWSAFLPEALRSARRNTEQIFDGVEKRFFLVWICLILIFFSLSSSKLIPYIAPIFPPIAVMMGHLFRLYEGDRSGWMTVPFRYRITAILQALLFVSALMAPLFILDWRVEPQSWLPWIAFPFLLQILIPWLPYGIMRRTGKGWFLTIYLLFSLFLVSVTIPVAQYLTPHKSALPLAQAIKTHVPAGVTLYQYGMSLYGIDFYTGMRTPIVDDIGEVGYGSEQLPKEERERYFFTSASFFQLVKEKSGIYCATERGAKLERLKKEIPALTVIWHNDAYYLVRLK